MSDDLDDVVARLKAERDPVTPRTLAELAPVNPDESLRRWKAAVAANNKARRNRRGRRNRDPYRDYRGVRRAPAAKTEEETGDRG